MPERIRLSRARGWRLPADARSVARPTRWGNPYRVGERGVRSRTEAVQRFALLLAMASTPGLPPYPGPEEIRAALAGRTLACWCPLPEPDGPDQCHAAILLRAANAPVVAAAGLIGTDGGGTPRDRREV